MKKIFIPIFICLCLIAYIVGYSTTTTTTNLLLVKPASEDITVNWFDTTNSNMDLIDAIFNTVSLTEFGYLDGVTSNIQTQLNAKATGDFSLYYLKTEIDTLPECETIWGLDVTTSTELATALTSYYLKTAIDTETEMETIWGVGLAHSGANSDITSMTGLTTALGAAYGGTGIANNAAETITIGGAGTYALTLTLTNTTNVTLPTSGTVLTNAANTIDSDQYVDASIDHEHLAPDVISGLTDVTSADADYMMIWDATDSALKKVSMAEVRGAGGGGYTNLTSFVAQTAWRLFYSNTDGDVVELALGGDGTYLKSNGATSAPTFDTPAAANEDAMEAFIFDADAESITGTWEVQDDIDLVFGNDANWAVNYDESVDDQLLFITAGTAAGAVTDPLFEIIVGATPTSNQEVFCVSKGTQASNTSLLALDEDGDMVIPGTFDAGSYLDKLSAFAATTSAELAGVISDETGTDKLVYSDSPTLVTPTISASRIRANRSANQVLPTGVYTIIQYNTEEYDNLGEYDNVTNYRFTATTTGYYLIVASLQSASTAWDAGEVFYLMLYVDGSAITQGSRGIAMTAGTFYISSIVTDMLYIVAGHYVDIRVYHSQGADINITTSTECNYFLVHRLS